jgi:hypothetical protein
MVRTIRATMPNSSRHTMTAHRPNERRQYALRHWPPELLAYREELRRAVAAVEERRRVAARR